ncbi:hypothetical protein BGZ72_010531 [Mortierella alpina]|nr:hypothetical protein BGZ72_010531 [Mortierella alpina]
MNSQQKRYLDSTAGSKLSLYDWAFLGEMSDPAAIDRVWTSNALPHMRSKGNNRSSQFLSKKDVTSRMAIWRKVATDREHEEALRPKVQAQLQGVADDITDDMQSARVAKRRMVEKTDGKNRSVERSQRQNKVHRPELEQDRKSGQEDELAHRQARSQTTRPIFDLREETTASVAGVDLLAPNRSTVRAVAEDEESDCVTDMESQASPCVAHIKRRGIKTGRSSAVDVHLSTAPERVETECNLDPTMNLQHFSTLGQSIEWNVAGTDMVQTFRDFRPENLGPYSLARDGIADLIHESTFSQYLDPDILSIARRVESAPDIYERWPTLGPICDRVFTSNNYDDVARAIRAESMLDPIAAYLFIITMAYWQYFQFHEEIPENIGEREGFSGLTWSFLQTPLTMYSIESRYLEVLITAVEARKNQDRDPLLNIKETGQYADAVALHNNHQLLLPEASLVHSPKLDKRRQDEFKLARAMRDSWISQVRSISSLAVPPRGLAVFGSLSFKDETKFMRMDFRGVFRLQQFDLFIIPLAKKDFGYKMRAAVISCLELAARLQQEIEQRR